MKNKISCSELLSQIPDELLEGLEEDTNVNCQTKKLRGKILFKLILFSLLNTERISLRVMEEFYNSEQFKVFSGGDKRKIKHSGIGERLSKVNFEFFQKIFEFLVEKFRSIFRKKSQKDIDIMRIDSTIVGLSANLLQIGIHGMGQPGKIKWQHMKYTVAMNKLPYNVKIFDQQECASEEIALKATILDLETNKNTVIVFDRGLQSRKTLREFSDKSIQFVTRTRQHIAYETVKIFKEVRGRKTHTLVLEKDLIVRIGEGKTRINPKEFRLIITKSLQTGEEIKFITNVMDLNAREITDIYKERWGIEVFFRFIKQELNLKHFVSRNLNGLKVMLYMTLITSLLLLVYKTKNKISGYKIAKLRFVLELEVDIIQSMALFNQEISLRKLKKPLPA